MESNDYAVLRQHQQADQQQPVLAASKQNGGNVNSRDSDKHSHEGGGDGFGEEFEEVAVCEMDEAPRLSEEDDTDEEDFVPPKNQQKGYSPPPTYLPLPSPATEEIIADDNSDTTQPIFRHYHTHGGTAMIPELDMPTSGITGKHLLAPRVLPYLHSQEQ